MENLQSYIPIWEKERYRDRVFACEVGVEFQQNQRKKLEPSNAFSLLSQFAVLITVTSLVHQILFTTKLCSVFFFVFFFLFLFCFGQITKLCSKLSAIPVMPSDTRIFTCGPTGLLFSIMGVFMNFYWVWVFESEVFKLFITSLLNWPYCRIHTNLLLIVYTLHYFSSLVENCIDL